MAGPPKGRKRIIHLLKDAAKAKGDLMQIRQSIHCTLAAIERINGRVLAVDPYIAAYRRVSRFRRWVLPGLAGLFSPRYRPAAVDKDEGILQLGRDVAQIAEHVDGESRSYVVSYADQLALFATGILELEYHLARARYDSRERKRVAEIANGWQHFANDLAAMLNWVATHAAAEYERLRSSIKELLDGATQIHGYLVSQYGELENRRLQTEEAADAVLASVLPEHRRPAEIILMFARNEFAHLLTLAGAGAKELSEFVVHLKDLARRDEWKSLDIRKLQRRVLALSEGMKRLVDRVNWGEEKRSRVE